MKKITVDVRLGEEQVQALEKLAEVCNAHQKAVYGGNPPSLGVAQMLEYVLLTTPVMTSLDYAIAMETYRRRMWLEARGVNAE